MRKRWEQVRAAFTRRIRYRITRGGLLFTLALLAVGFGAILSANNLLFLILAAMLATFLVSGVVSRLGLAALELDFLVPEHVPAGRHVPGKLFVRNRKWLMPSFSIRVEAIRDPDSPSLRSGVYFALVAAGETLEGAVDVRFPRRGAYRQNSFAFSTSFPFGFLEKAARVTLRREMIVYPSIDPQPGFDDLLLGIAGEIETHYRGLGKDFYRIRPYEAMESSRHVDWKASAHVGSLQVREFAREQEQTVEMYLDRDVPPALDAWFEHAVDCCAFLAWSLSNQGASIHFRAQGFDFRQPEDGDIYTILKYLALVYPQRAEETEPPLEETSYKILLTASPRRFLDAGWLGARILDPGVLPIPPGGAGNAAA
ncbi:MAG: DUF58 domain-containing protein [Acidobacteriia bacterium]|nr:DUF58 domain-containing protein [Terriglobia bacterium]